MVILGIKKNLVKFAAVLLASFFLLFPIYFGPSEAEKSSVVCRTFSDKNESFWGWLVSEAFAETLNEGSDFTVCAHTTYQPAYTTEAAPNITVFWTFSSPAGNTQKSYQVQIDDNSDFSSAVVDTGVVADASARSYNSTSGLSFGTNYYWRILVVDNLDSVKDWTVGDSFKTNKPSIKLKGGVKLQGGVKLK